MSPLNVCQVVGDPVGGIRKHIDLILREGVRRGDRMFFFHSSTTDAAFRDDDSFRHDVTCMVSRVAKRPHPSDVVNIIRLCHWCRTNGIRLIHGHGSKGGLYARIVGKIVGIAVLYTPHGGSVHDTYGKLEGYIYRTVERLLIPLTDCFIFESAYTRNRFVSAVSALPEQQSIVNVNGIDCQKPVPERNWSDGIDDCLNLLVVGILRKIKGQEVAIRALPLLKEKKIRARLHFCGAGEDHQMLETLARELGVGDEVFFHGDVDNIDWYYADCNLVIVPSLFESFGYVSLEAALMNRPVIASNAGGIPEVVRDGETGKLFKPGDSRELAQRIEETIRDREATDRMIANARSRCVLEFNVKRMVGNLFNIYEKLCSQ
jgi:glycosyltransferase involved in cell wall biosynthesis